MKLLGRKALVTGAGRGIGRGCALELAKAGADVAINDLRPSDMTDEVLQSIRKLGRQAELVDGDAFDRKSCESIVARAIDRLGHIDILISNPAYSRTGDFLEFDPDLFERILRGTLVSGFHTSQLVARHMVARAAADTPTETVKSRGKIVFISSVHSRVPYARSVAYNAAKAGLNHMAFTIATELLPHRINVNLIEPGWIETPGEYEKSGDAIMKSAGPTLPWGRLGTVEDIGRAATYLCSDDADYVTGSSLLVDGGYWLRGAQPHA